MPYFGSRSLQNLSECHPHLQRLAQEAIKHIDFSIITGHRSRADQELAFKRKLSKAPWPKSKHNHTPSLAFDFIPWPFPWRDWECQEAQEAFANVVEVFKICEANLGIHLEYGYDWGWDKPHVELITVIG